MWFPDQTAPAPQSDLQEQSDLVLNCLAKRLLNFSKMV